MSSDNPTIKDAANKILKNIEEHENTINGLEENLNKRKEILIKKRKDVEDKKLDLKEAEKVIVELKENENNLLNESSNNVKNEINNAKLEMLDLKEGLEEKRNEIFREETKFKKLER